MAMPQEEVLRPQEQVAAGAESSGPGGEGPHRAFDPLTQYLLHRVDALEAGLRGEFGTLREETSNSRQETNARIEGLREEMGNLRQETNAGFEALRQEVRSEMAGLRGEVCRLHEQTCRLEVGVEKGFRKLAWWAVGIIATVIASAFLQHLL